MAPSIVLTLVRKTGAVPKPWSGDASSGVARVGLRPRMWSGRAG